MMARVGRAVEHDSSPERVFIPDLCTEIVRPCEDVYESTKAL
jgi:hypothetical protein